MRLEVYVENLGRYCEGYIVGRFVKLPIKEEDFEKVLNEIGVDGINYEEYFVADVETDVSGLSECISEYVSIRELNNLAENLMELTENETEKLSAILEYERFSSIQSIIKAIKHLDNWDLYPDIEDSADLGRLYADEFQTVSIPDNIKNYFDYEAYGQDIQCSLTCCFTSYGFLIDNN